jgi:inhibitor of cysteine peptidase
MLLLAGAFAAQMTAFDQSAIWQPPADFRTKVLAACHDAGPKFGDCFAAQMKAAGASNAALAFSRLFDNNAYMQAYRPLQPVGIAAVNYPFRANENDDLALVNGDPSPVSLGDVRRLPSDQMKADQVYQRVTAQYPAASLWPGDRSSVDLPLVITHEDGSEQVVAAYLVRNQCHACAVLGQAFFRFDFDRNGKLTATRFTGFREGWSGIQSHTAQSMIVVKRGETLTVLLPSRAGTGYSWAIEGTDGKAPLTKTSQKFETAGQTRPGEGGEEHLQFRAAESGEGTVRFVYRRPWEKNAAPAKTLDVTVRVE